MILEFFGIAGAGKSTIARALVERMRAANLITGSGLMSGAGASYGLVLAHAPDYLLAVKVQALIRGKPGWEALKSRALFADLVRGRLGRRTFPVWVADQGICQRISTLHKRHSSDWNSGWLPLLRHHPAMPDVVVFVTAPVKVIMQRLQQRDGETVGHEFFVPAIRRGERMLRDLQEYYAAYTSESRVITVDNGWESCPSRHAADLFQALSALAIFPKNHSMDQSRRPEAVDLL